MRKLAFADRGVSHLCDLTAIRSVNLAIAFPKQIPYLWAGSYMVGIVMDE